MLKVDHMTKQFDKTKAIDDITFRVEKGEIFGILGENGAGKTTTLRTLATMLKPTSGTATINGYDIILDPHKVRGSIGVLFGGETGLYDRLSVQENIEYFGELNGMEKAEIKKRIEFLAEVFGMKEYLLKRAVKLSKGMKQKAAFARSIVHNPEVMLLDEPTSGLDVSTIRDVHTFILDLKKEGKTLVISSHTMSEVEKLCDRIGIIHRGKLLDVGTKEELITKYQQKNLEEVFIGLVGEMQ